jgi:hypothetical protein
VIGLFGRGMLADDSEWDLYFGGLRERDGLWDRDARKTYGGIDYDRRRLVGLRCCLVVLG